MKIDTAINKNGERAFRWDALNAIGTMYAKMDRALDAEAEGIRQGAAKHGVVSEPGSLAADYLGKIEAEKAALNRLYHLLRSALIKQAP